MVLGSNVSRCHLCFAVAWDSGLPYFLRNMTSTSCRVWRLMEFMFLNVCNAPFCSNEWKRLIFICSVIAGCILIIVWNKSSKRSNFSLFPSKVIGVVWTGLMVMDWGLFCKLTNTSANLLSGSCEVVARETLLLDFCLSRFGIEWIRPVRNSGICSWFSIADCGVSHISYGPWVIFSDLRFGPRCVFPILLTIRGQTVLSVPMTCRWHWLCYILNLRDDSLSYSWGNSPVYLTMHHGHHWVHFLGQPEIKFIGESLKRLSNIVLPHRVILICEITVLIATVPTCIYVLMDRWLFYRIN